MIPASQGGLDKKHLIDIASLGSDFLQVPKKSDVEKLIILKAAVYSEKAVETQVVEIIFISVLHMHVFTPFGKQKLSL
jgi:hypothetical protein